MSEAAAERGLRPVDEPQADSSLSVLGQLKGRRESIITDQILDLPVPRWDNPTIIVRYKPVDHKVFKAAGFTVDKLTGDKRSEAEVSVNADILIKACVGVFAVVNGQKYSLRPGEPEGDWTKFDGSLAENLGCGKTGREVVKALYITDGDILSTASKISEFSGYKEQEADEQLLGE